MQGRGGKGGRQAEQAFANRWTAGIGVFMKLNAGLWMLCLEVQVCHVPDVQVSTES